MVNQIITSGSFVPSKTNTPLDVRTRITTKDNFTTIPNPFVGMLVYVEDEGKYYKVKAIDENGVISEFVNIVFEEGINLNLVENNEFRLKKDTDIILDKLVNRINSISSIATGIRFVRLLLSNDGNAYYIEGTVGAQHLINANIKCLINIFENGVDTKEFEVTPTISDSTHTIYDVKSIIKTPISELLSISCTVKVDIDGEIFSKEIKL